MKNRTFVLNNVGSTLEVMQQVDKTLGISNLKGEKKTAFDNDKLGWTSQLTSGIWLVPIRAGDDVDHCVVVDVFLLHIVDSEEDYPLHLCKESLIACAGDGAINPYIAEIREVIDKRKTTN